MGIVCHGPVAIGHDGVYGQLPLDVRSSDDNQLLVYDDRAQAVNRGGGIMFGATYTDAGAEAVGARVGIRKYSSISGEAKFDLVFETQEGSGLTEAFRVASNQNVGFGTEVPESRVEVEGDEQFLLRLDCSEPYALGSGGGLLFSGRTTGGNTASHGGYIGIEKWNATNGDPGYDLVFQTHRNNVGDMVEMLRLSAEDRTATVAGVSISGGDTGNFYLVGSMPSGIGTAYGNVVIGNSSLQNVTDDGNDNIVIGTNSGAGITDGTQNIIIGPSSGNDTGGGSTDIDYNNILIGFTCETITGKSASSLNLGNIIWGDLGTSHLRIGGGQGTALLTSAALEINSTTGALVVPRMTTSQRTALTPVNGMIIYDTGQNAFRKYQNGSWASF